jgi:parallel beta-helix repeat protein
MLQRLAIASLMICAGLASSSRTATRAIARAAGNPAAQAKTGVRARRSSWDPAVLGVSWTADFTSIAANEINVRVDARLGIKAEGDGATDDTSAIREAIQLAFSSGGGVVYFPAGDYKIVASSGSPHGDPLILPSRVILRGSGPTQSRLFLHDQRAQSETDWVGTWGGIEFRKASLSGMSDLGVYAVNPSSRPCALLWNRGSGQVNELFFNHLDVHLENCKSFWFENTNKLLVQNTQFESDALQDGPIYVVRNSNVVFRTNQINYRFSRVHMQNNTNLLMQGNRLIRDAQKKDMQQGTAVESGGVELSFGQNLQVVDNTIQTLNAPEGENGDGEAILTQNSSVPDVLDAGRVTAIKPASLTDSSALWANVTASRLPHYQEVVAILTGPATGEWRTIKGIDTNTKTIILDQAWDSIPEVGSLYSIFPWNLMHANIQGNTLIDNPNGIVLYEGCYDCTVQNNTLTNSRGIMLRTIDRSLPPSPSQENRRVHLMAMQSKILNNIVLNTSGVRPVYIALDIEAFDKSSYRGAGMIDIEVAGNVIRPYPANASKSYPGNEISQEGIFPCFLYGPAPVKDPVTTVFRDIRVWDNSLSAPITYASGFLPYTGHACVTTSHSPGGHA